MRVSAEPRLLTLAFSVTVGSVLTPFGNPQNLLVWLGSGLHSPVATLLRYLALPTAVNLVLGGYYLRRVYGRKLAAQVERNAAPASTPVPFFPAGGVLSPLRRFPVLVLLPVTMLAIISVDVAAAVTSGPAVPLYAVALGGAVVTLLVSPGRSSVFGRVDGSILVLFASLFVVVAGAVNGGVLSAIGSAVPIPGPGQPGPSLAAILLTSVGGSRLVSDVPWVALQTPMLHTLGYGPATPWAWMALAGGSTLAGNLTLLGPASNLIVVEQAVRAGVRIGLRAFVRVGLPLTAMTVVVLFLFLWAGS